MKILLNALIKFICGIILVGVLVFLPAGTIEYINGLLFVSALFIPVMILGVYLWLNDPELLKKRLDSKEKEPVQKRVVALSGLMFIVGFTVAGLDFRFGWSDVPENVVIAATVLFILGYVLYAEVMRENSYLSRTVKVEKGQKIIDTGLYGIVRHPMYMATVLMFLMIPIILGSWYSLIIFICYPIVIVFRITNEEKVLEAGLEGYIEYKKKVKYRIIPFVW